MLTVTNIKKKKLKNHNASTKIWGFSLRQKGKGKKLQISQAHTDSFTQGPTVAFNKHKQKGLIYISLSLTITAEMYL